METQAHSVAGSVARTGRDCRPEPDAIELGRQSRTGEVSPGRALDKARSAAYELNSELNCITRFVDVDERSFADADRNVPVWGVPFLLKDAFATLRGAPTSNGTGFYDSDVAKEDSVLVTRLKAAGLQIFGKTNCPPFNSLATTENGAFGSTPNPLDKTRSAGGSSGGSAAAVAAGIVPAAHGSDGAGSIRIPAAYCGLVGLKPSRGRITLQPVLGETVNGGMSEGVLTRTVRDSAAFLDILAGPAPGDSCIAPPPHGTFLDAIDAPLGPVGVAVVEDAFAGAASDADCLSILRGAAAHCERLGHRCDRTFLEFDPMAYRADYRRIWPVSVGRSIRAVEVRLGASLQQRLDPFNRHLYALASQTEAIDLVLAVEAMQRTARRFFGWMESRNIDVVMSLTTPGGVPELGHFDAQRHGAPEVYERFLDQTSYTTLANVTGAPAVSLPLGRTPDGLPVGIQLLGRYGDEAVLLALAAQLEAAHARSPVMPVTNPTAKTETDPSQSTKRNPVR